MIKKYIYGSPIETDAVISSLTTCSESPCYGNIHTEDGFSFSYKMEDRDIVFGLGEANRGINKRGFIYTSNCTDDPVHTEEKSSLYGAHNYILMDGKERFGLFFDYAGYITFDVGYTQQNLLKVTSDSADLTLYVIDGDSLSDITKQFRTLIGMSYVAPRWAFGYQQSRWGYEKEEDFLAVLKGYRENHIPLDAIYMDIDYMERFKDFTVDKEKFNDFTAFVQNMKENSIHLVPIIDAGVRIEEGYDVYEDGVANNHFCKREDGSNFVAGVWPGRTHFPDMLNKESRDWFGNQYKVLLDEGIDGFWNDMNEPCMFYTDEGLSETFEAIDKYKNMNLDVNSMFEFKDKILSLANNPKDYKRFYHNINGTKIRHDKVHNLYGFNMTRAAGEAFERLVPEKRILMFSRASYIGMHRYGGVWTGDNHSWWSHLLLNIKMMPSLNMCGFLYSGADLGGFGANTSRDLLLRWLAFGIFTPLMRNHSAKGTREQECYQFENCEDFAHLLRLRYRLIPYLYSEYMKATLDNEMYIRPLAFDFPEDEIARYTEDQLMLGDALMLAPVYTANALGRNVYLPEDMLYVKFKTETDIETALLEKGHHFIEVSLTEVPVFIRKNQLLPLCDACESTDKLDTSVLQLIGHIENDTVYTLYEDDGLSKNYSYKENFITITAKKEGANLLAASSTNKTLSFL